ncbi:MAG: glycogen/starch/alpha-glucan phosphorylase [Gammaproteobacteria bacterium]|nr:glycogen/starch/alpha-glucan phosphorylase [Gammaproteobacteria bacterium]MBI5615770.1 glycogen/starch/alpha-glucan phosphorylase [Gammaproteobacteria bacterium]
MDSKAEAKFDHAAIVDTLATRTGLSVEAIKRDFLDNLFYVQGRSFESATAVDHYQALAATARDRMLRRFVRSSQVHKTMQNRTICYLSAEYLPGPHLANNLINLGILEQTRTAMTELGVDFELVLDQEEEPGLGNGGLGRLAACFMDSLATLEIPAIGYGIRYEFGIFDQVLHDGWQHEVTDTWLRHGNPWELRRSRTCFDVRIGGRTEQYADEHGRLRAKWVGGETIRGVANDTPILGYGVANANLLRLWSAESPVSFDFKAFNLGDYYGAVQHKVQSETISKVLYPNDEPETGKRLRLIQQHFFVSCALQDMIRLYCQSGVPLERFHEKFVVQLNDTHPAIAVAELMRLLVDEHHLDWDAAWNVTTQTFAYTNHTLLPEALEKWPVPIFQSILPRHLEIVYAINSRFLDEVRVRFLNDWDRVARMSIIDETEPRYVRMANLACVGSFAVNGVAELHSRLLCDTVLKDFHDMWPEKFHNKTNGVTPRRFLMNANPGLAGLIREVLGTAWERDLAALRGLEPYAEDAAFRARWRAVKAGKKAELAARIEAETGVRLDPATLFDIQAKRIHEYKRQHLNILHVISLYSHIKRDPGIAMVPRTFVFGGKAAPGYHMAKLIIKLVNSVAAVVNHDPQVADRLKVIFVPNFNVKVAQFIYPAADLSEQISTAGKEASGTGNMKFSLNGALTIGTLDGANVEIREEVGAENFFLFGLTAEEVMRRKAEGYRPRDYYDSNADLRAAIDLIERGLFSHGDPRLFRPLVDALLEHDEYLAFADFESYAECQRRVSLAYTDVEAWTRMSILNTARLGKFSSDRAILEYNRDVWRVPPVPIDLNGL